MADATRKKGADLMLTPKEYALADAAMSEAIGLDAAEHAMLFCVDENGDRWTLITDDADYLRVLAEAAKSGSRVLADLELPPDKFPLRREGWPDDWTGNLTDAR